MGTAFFDFPQMLPQPHKKHTPVAVIDSLPEFFQCEMNDIVMVYFLRRNLAAQFEPDAMQQIDLLRSQARRVRTKIENVFLPSWEIDLKSELRLRIM